MEEVVTKPKWSNFNVRNSKNISEFFRIEGLEQNQNVFSLALLRDYYRSDSLKCSDLIEELSLRGYSFVSNNETGILPNNYESTKYIRVNSLENNNYKKINFHIIGISDIISKFHIDNDKFFEYIPIEGFLKLNKNVLLDIIENEFKNAGFVLEPIDSCLELSAVDLMNINKCNKLSNVFKKKKIISIEDFRANVEKVISETLNLNLYDAIRLRLISDWFDSDCKIKDVRNISVKEYFNGKDDKFNDYCRKMGYVKVIDMLTDPLIKTFNKTVVIYYDTFISYLKAYNYVNISPEIRNYEINKIEGLGTSNTIEALNGDNIYTIAELLKADLNQVKGIGKEKIKNIEVAILRFVDNPDINEEKNIIIQDNLCNIKIKDFFYEPSFRKFVDYCEKKNYIYIKDLTSINLSNEIKSNKILNENEIIDKLSDKKYNISSSTELFNVLFDEYIEKNNNLYSILYERIVDGKTLEQLGIEKNISRERIRQKEVKGMLLLQHATNILFDLILNSKKYLCISEDKLNEIFRDANKSKIMFSILRTRKEFYSENDFGKLFIISNYPECKLFLSEIKVLLNGEAKCCKDIMSLEEIKKEINNIIKKYNLEEWIVYRDFNKMIANCNYKFVGNILMRKGTYIHDIYLRILKENFPNGITFNKENCEKMKEIFYKLTKEKSDLSVKNLSSKLQREKDVIICGSNTYIHIDNVKSDKELFKKIKKYIDYLFEQEGLPSVYSDRIYKVFKEELNKIGINNYAYIYGVLRYYYPEDFNFDNYWITKKNNKGITRDLALIDYLKKDTNYNEGISKEKLISLFGLSGPFLFNLTVNVKEIQECHNKENLIYYENYKLSAKLLDKIKSYIDENIDSQYGYISLKFLFNRYNIYLEEEKIIDENTLGNALKKYIKKYYIKGQYMCKNETRENLDEYFFFNLYLENNNVITRKGFETFAEEKGIISSRIYDVLRNKFEELYQINISDFTKTIKITIENISAIYKIIDKNFEGKQYLPLSELKKNGDLYKMPSINYSWNEYLLRTILIKNLPEKYVMIDIPGAILFNKKGILIKKELGITDYIDFLVYVYKQKNFYSLESVNQLLKELQSLGLVNDTFPNELRKRIVDEYGRLIRC